MPVLVAFFGDAALDEHVTAPGSWHEFVAAVSRPYVEFRVSGATARYRVSEPVEEFPFALGDTVHLFRRYTWLAAGTVVIDAIYPSGVKSGTVAFA